MTKQLKSSPELLVPWKQSQEATRASAVPRFTRILECLSLCSSTSLPNLVQITDPGKLFFSRQLPYFYTHSFSFSQFIVSENLSTRMYEPSKGHKGIFGPLESPSLPVTTWLPPSDGMLCGMERTFCPQEK